MLSIALRTGESQNTSKMHGRPTSSLDLRHVRHDHLVDARIRRCNVVDARDPGRGAGCQDAPNPDNLYRLGPDSLEQDGVPKGEIRGPFTLPSAAYPGTQHTYWVYVPAQYTPSMPASLMIFNDGQAFKNTDGRHPRAERAGQPDLPPRDSGDDRASSSIPAARPISPSRRRRTGATATPTGRPSTTRSTTATPASSSTSCCRCCTRSTTSRRTPSGTASAAPAPGRSPRSPSPGSGRTSSARCSASSAASPTSAAGTSIPTSCASSEKKPIRIFLQDGRNDNRGVGRGGTYDETRDWFFQNVRLMKALTREGLRRQLRLGHRTATARSRAARSCRR